MLKLLARLRGATVRTYTQAWTGANTLSSAEAKQNADLEPAIHPGD